MESDLDRQEFAYITITGEGIAADIKEKYRLKPYEAWDAGEISEGSFRFEQMCLRYKSHLDNSDSIADHVSCLLDYSQNIESLPDEFVRTLHGVTYGFHNQAAGWHLDSETIRRLAQRKLDAIFYLYKMEVIDNHNHPYAKQVETTPDPYLAALKADENAHGTGEYAYFVVSSKTLYAHEISRILQLTPTSTRSIGDAIPQSPDHARKLTSWELGSGLPKGQPIALHLEALLLRLLPHADQLYLLSRDFQTSFGISSTGKFREISQIHLSQHLIRQMAELNLSLDFDGYLRFNN